VKIICSREELSQTLVFCFRGTQDAWNHLQNLNTHATTQLANDLYVSDTMYNSLVHSGIPAFIAGMIRFYAAGGSLQNVEFIGHSRGGAHALIALALLKHNLHFFLGTTTSTLCHL
jgi:hypothetical protein